MSSMRLIAVAVVPMLLGMGGCNATPNLDSKFGYAVNAAKAQQTLNPDAALKADPVAGIDAPAAEKSIREYHKSFEKPPRTFPILIMGTGEGR